MRPEGENIILYNQRDLDIALTGARQARPLKGYALRELLLFEDRRPPYKVGEFTSQKIINGLKRIALRDIPNPYLSSTEAEKLLEDELEISLFSHRL
jgi:hypothetical protein